MKFKYIINKEKGFTKVIASDFAPIADEIWNDQSIRPVNSIVNWLEGFSTDNLKEISAITKCSESDEYKMVLGQDIAENKASLKYHKAMVGDYKALIKKMKFYVDKLEKKLEYHERKVKNISDNLNERYMPPKKINE